MSTEISQTLDRGLQVLGLLADRDHGLTVSEVSQALGVNRTVVYRLLATLEQHAFIRRDADGRAWAGLGLLSLGRAMHGRVRDAALPVLRSLAEDVGASAHLTLADGGEALVVAVAQPSWTDFHVACRVGARRSLDRGAAGRAILEARRRDRSNHACTPLCGEFGEGGFSVAAHLPGADGVEAAVGVVLLTGRGAERVVALVADAAQQITENLRAPRHRERARPWSHVVKSTPA